MTFWLKSDSLSIESIESFFFKLSNMKALNPNGSQIQEIQQVEEVQNFLKRFLDRCFEHDSFYAEFMQYLGDLAFYKHEEIPVILENLRSVSELLVTLIGFEKSIQIEFSDCNDFILKNFKSQKPISSTNKSKSSIAFKHFHAYLVQLLDTMTCRNEFLAAFINDYWDYIPDAVQNLIIKSVSFFSSENLSFPSFSELNEIEVSPLDVNLLEMRAKIQVLESKIQAYVLSANLLKEILSSSFIEASSSVPKIPVSISKVDNSQKDIALSFNYVPLIANKGYTLDTLSQKFILP